MTPLGRRTVIGLAVLAVALFAGRGAAEFLAERWWASSANPSGAVFSTRWALFRLALDAGATILAVAWFAGHFQVAARLTARATEGTARARSVPPLPAAQLRIWSIPAALILGLLCGAGTAESAGSLALAWQVPRWGLLDPFHNLDVGFYVAILPALIRVHFFALALALLGLIAVVILYAVGGSLRVASRRFVLDPGIRLHLGLLGAMLALVLGLGYVLEPYEFAAGLRPATGAAHVVLLSSMSWLLVGLAFAAGVLTLYWGLRGRIVLPVGAWAAFGLFALVIRLLAPAAGSVGEGDREPEELRELEREAFGLPELIYSRPPERAELPSSLQMEGLWDPRALVPPGGGRWVAAARTTWSSGDATHPVLLLVADAGLREAVSVVLVLDDQAGPEGHPLSIREDGVAYPGVVPLLQLPRTTARPGALGVQLVREGEAGVSAGGLFRRLLLTWTLQRNLLSTAPESRVFWRLDPRERLAALAPFAEWGTPRPVLDGGTLMWLSDGYLHSSAFPGVMPVPWRGRPASYLRASFVGVVNAQDGKVRIFERGSPHPLSLAWAAIARELVETESAMPVAWAAALIYPAEWFASHATVLRRRHWQLGALASAPPGAGFDSIPSPILHAAYQSTEGRRLLAILEGERIGAAEQLRVIRLDSMMTAESPVLLPARWERLPFIQQTRDSALAIGWRYQAGPLRFRMSDAGPLGWQSAFVVDSAGQGTLAALNLALGGRLGTGADPAAAWENLRGIRAAFPVSLGEQIRLRQAREWLLRADSAMRRGDLAGFGRAFEALRAILDRP